MRKFWTKMKLNTRQSRKNEDSELAKNCEVEENKCSGELNVGQIENLRNRYAYWLVTVADYVRLPRQMENTIQHTFDEKKKPKHFYFI